MNTDITEEGLESLIARHLTGTDALSVPPGSPAESHSAGNGYFAGSPKDYDRAYCLDLAQLFTFLCDTHPLRSPNSQLPTRPTRAITSATSSLPASQTKSPSAVPSTFFARASTTARSTWISPTPRPLPATPRPKPSTRRTVSPSPVSLPTAATKPAARSISAFSSTACPSPPSN